MLIPLLGGNPEEGDPLGQTGLTYKPSMDIHDASKIQAFMDSPRKYFYQHILGWHGEDPNIHLVFGSAWHDAMEHMFLSLNTNAPYSNKVIMEAFELFLETYRSRFPREWLDEQYGAKTPENALKALAGYAATWRDDPKHLQTLYTEVAVSAPVREDRILFGKMDSIVLRDNSFVQSYEHKTTGRKTTAWMNSWDVLVQPWLYNYILSCLYEPESVKGIIINGAILRDKTNEFIRVPVKKTDKMLEQGLWQANHYLDQIEWNMENLLESSPDDEVMAAFPCNGVSCSKFGCAFSGLCSHVANPLQISERPPTGFVTEFWNPLREQENAKNVVNLAEGNEIKPVGK